MTDQPVVTVNTTIMNGAVVSWHRSVSAAETRRPTLTASRHGVQVHDIYLTDVPDEWVEAAKAAHRKLARAPRADMSGLATHQQREVLGARSGPLEPITKEDG